MKQKTHQLHVSASKTAEFFTARAEQADISLARQILKRKGGQAPAADDLLP